MERAIEAGARVRGKRARPPEDDVVELNDYKAAALLEGMDSSLRAAMISGLKPQIKRIVYRKRVYEQALRLYRDKARQKRQKITNKFLAAVALGATSGSEITQSLRKLHHHYANTLPRYYANKLRKSLRRLRNYYANQLLKYD